MAIINQMELIVAVSVIAGVIGAMLGLGGGILLVPIFTLLFHIPVRLAVGASLISVIATSSGAAVAYVKDGMTNLRLGMFLEIATTTGAVMGAYLAGVLSTRILYGLFALMLAYSAYALIQQRSEELPDLQHSHPLARRLRLASYYHDAVLKRDISYKVGNPYGGLSLMWVAGMLSGLLGIGSGLLKVMALDVVMKLPMKVSTATSNFMIGVTAAASAGVYFARGDIRPLIAAPTALGVLLGAVIGTKIMERLKNRTLRYIFFPVLSIVAVEMFFKAL